MSARRAFSYIGWKRQWDRVKKEERHTTLFGKEYSKPSKKSNKPTSLKQTDEQNDSNKASCLLSPAPSTLSQPTN